MIPLVLRTSLLLLTGLAVAYCREISDIRPMPSGSLGDTEIGNSRPLIGILSQPGDGSGHETKKRIGDFESNSSYIAASYVKFVEAAGARAVPILFDTPEEDLPQIFSAINGLLFPGGGASTALNSTFMKTAKRLLEMAIEANEKGDAFPIHGTCLGFEMLNILISQNETILEHLKAEGIPSTLDFISPSAENRGPFAFMAPNLRQKVTKVPLAFQNHEFALSPQGLQESKPLSSFFRILTTSRDENNRPYISTVEGLKYPFFGTQWHPEKNPFEWSSSTVPHTADAVALTQAFAENLVSWARKSKHTPISIEQEYDLLIYNYAPRFTGKYGKGYFFQSYVFDLVQPKPIAAS